MNNCREIVVPALESTLDEYEIASSGNFCRITTPFQHFNGDLVELWIRNHQGEKVSVRDRGETFAMLRLYGVDPEAKSRSERLEQICDQYDVTMSESEISVEGFQGELGQLILKAIQATLATSRLIYKHQSRPPVEFKTKVESFLYDSEYDFDVDYDVAGTASERTFDFSINSRSPVVLLDTLHSRTDAYLTQQVEHIMLNWHEVREKKFDHGVVLDDVESDFDEEDVADLKRNLDHFFEWSDRGEILDEIPISA